LTWWIGWVLFAGIVLMTAGVLNMIQGSVALFDEGYYVATAADLVVEVSYPTWGWALLLVGVLLLVTGYGVLAGYTWASVVGAILCAVDAVLNFAFMAAYPVWSIVAVGLNVIVIYALDTHGREPRVLRH